VAASGRSAWAVGLAGRARKPTPLIARWRGGAWKRVSSPFAASGGLLNAVAVAPDGGAWAVGQTRSLDSMRPTTLIERWNGTRWRIVPSPNLATRNSVLYGLAVTSTRGAWAVGCTGCLRAKPETLILRWNGTAWKRVPSPNPADGGTLAGVAVTSARNAWAVGYTEGPSQRKPKTVIERWDGTKWKLVPSPSPTGTARLFGVAGASTRSAWAVGLSGGLFSANPKTVALHWNGTAWQ